LGRRVVSATIEELNGPASPRRRRGAHDDDYDCGNWSDERFAWRRAAIVTLKEPIPYRGQQGMFTLPPEVAGRILSSQAADVAGSMGHHP